MSSIIILLVLLGNQSSTVPGKKPVAAKPAATKKVVVVKPVAAKPAAAKPAATKNPVAAKPAAKPAVKPARATIALKRQKPSARMISGTVRRPKNATPVHLAQAPATPKAITLKAADKRKVKTEKIHRPKTVQYPPIGIYQIHLREFVSIRVYDENGFLRPAAPREFNHISRCQRTGVVLPMDYRLLVELYDAWIAFGMPSVTLFSGCRQAPDSSDNSRHNFGTAIDYNFDGVTRRELISWLLNRREQKVHGIGLGYYPNGYHIHMDVRDTHAFWVDLNAAGEKGSKMVADSYQWFATEHKLRSRTQLETQKETPAQGTAEVTPKEVPGNTPAP